MHAIPCAHAEQTGNESKSRMRALTLLCTHTHIDIGQPSFVVHRSGRNHTKWHLCSSFECFKCSPPKIAFQPALSGPASCSRITYSHKMTTTAPTHTHTLANIHSCEYGVQLILTNRTLPNDIFVHMPHYMPILHVKRSSQTTHRARTHKQRRGSRGQSGSSSSHSLTQSVTLLKLDIL